ASVGWWTPPGCGGSSGTPRSTPPRRRSTTSCSPGRCGGAARPAPVPAPGPPPPGGSPPPPRRSAAPGGGPPAAPPPPAADPRPAGAEWERRVAAALAFLRRRATGQYEVDEFGYDAELARSVLMPLFRPLYRLWWRVELSGLANIPDHGGALVVANHAGTLV